MLKLDINMVFNIINILILYLLMKKFLFGPINKIMEKRKKSIEDSLATAEDKNNEALKLKKQYEDHLANAEEQAAIIINEAKEKALVEHNKQIQQTKEEIAKMIEEANKSIELERKKATIEIQADITQIALAAASKVIKKNVDDSINTHLINDFLHEVGVSK